MATLTSANSTLMLGVKNLFNIPVKIEGFATDDMFDIQDVQSAEILMGCDGHLSAGWIPKEKELDITLQADSPSNAFFDALTTAEAISREKYEINGTFLLSGVSRIYTLTRGFIETASVMPAAKKTLQPRKFKLKFQDMTGAPV